MEQTNTSGVNGEEGDWRSREQWSRERVAGLRELWDEK
jgi:hypothetical protein